MKISHMARFMPAVLVVALVAAQTSRPRARELGLAPGVYSPGPLNAITDVAGVRVGHVTLIEGDDVRTGVTAIVPADGNLFQNKIPGAVFVGNAFGKLAGSTQVEELGTIETPIVLTNTLSVGAAMEGVIAYTLAQPGNERVTSVNALVGETNDSGLNDIRGMRVKPKHRVPVPAPTLPSTTAPPLALRIASTTFSRFTCIPRISFRPPSLVSPDRKSVV